MTFLKVSIQSEGNNPGKKQYKNKVNANNFKEISLVLTDLKSLGLPIEKAIKDFRMKTSDWDSILGV